MKTQNNQNQVVEGLPVRSSMAVSEQSRSTSSRPQIDLHLRAEHRARSTNEMLALLRAEAPEFYSRTEIVGQWLWIQFPDRQPKEVTAQLAQLGFHWNNARQAWQHPCGKLTAGSPGDPREKYGTRCPADYQPA